MTLKDFTNVLEEEFEGLEKGSLRGDTDFRDVLEWSSLNALKIMALIEIEFHVAITVKELQSCYTVSDLYNIVNESVKD